MSFSDRLEELLGKREETFGIFAIERELLRNADAILELVRAAEPFVHFANKYDEKPLGRMDDTVYTIHGGTQWEASLRRSDCNKLRAALAKLNGEQT